MPDKYIFELTHENSKTIKLELNNFPAEFADSWKDISDDLDNCLIDSAGSVKSQNGSLYCKSGTGDIILNNANWNNKVHDTDAATIEQNAPQCSSDGWSWELISKT